MNDNDKTDAVARNETNLPAKNEKELLIRDIELTGLKKIKELLKNEKSIYNIAAAVKLANDLLKENPQEKKQSGLLDKIKAQNVTINIAQIEPKKS